MDRNAGVVLVCERDEVASHGMGNFCASIHVCGSVHGYLSKSLGTGCATGFCCTIHYEHS
jgi:hypothetical protein